MVSSKTVRSFSSTFEGATDGTSGTALLAHALDSSGIFIAAVGGSYWFQSVARDPVGNTEAALLVADEFERRAPFCHARAMKLGKRSSLFPPRLQGQGGIGGRGRSLADRWIQAGSAVSGRRLDDGGDEPDGRLRRWYPSFRWPRANSYEYLSYVHS
jgi:hypothetical protein